VIKGERSEVNESIIPSGGPGQGQMDFSAAPPFGRKFHLPSEKIESILDFFRRSGIPVIAHPLTVVLPGPDGLPFLEAARRRRSWRSCRVRTSRESGGSRLRDGLSAVGHV